MAVGDSNLFFNRDTKVYAVQPTAVGASTFNVWEVPVLQGYSYSQSTNASQVTLNEMSDATGRSRRGQRSFNDSLAPAEWSFDTYARPTLATVVRAPEEFLWHSLLTESYFDPAAGRVAGITVTGWSYVGSVITLTVASHPFKLGDYATVAGLTATTNAPNGEFQVTALTGTTISFVAAVAPTGTAGVASAKVTSLSYSATATALDYFPRNSNKTTLATFDLYFVLGGYKWISENGTPNFTASDQTTIYKIEDCVVNEATMNFEIDGIATVSWSGMGKVISEVAAINFTNSGTYTLITNGVAATSNMIRNRLTALTLQGIAPAGVAKTYGITLTGGSITISNNISFLTPEVLGVVNVPLGHVVGTRTVSGSFTCYMDEATGGSIDLYQDLLGATTAVTNKFNLQFFVGGKAAGGTSPVGPGIMFDMGQCHLEVPSVNIDDVIGLEVNFTALPSTISGTDELTKIRYVA